MKESDTFDCLNLKRNDISPSFSYFHFSHFLKVAIHFIWVFVVFLEWKLFLRMKNRYFYKWGSEKIPKENPKSNCLMKSMRLEFNLTIDRSQLQRPHRVCIKYASLFFIRMLFLNITTTTIVPSHFERLASIAPNNCMSHNYAFSWGCLTDWAINLWSYDVDLQSCV